MENNNKVRLIRGSPVFQIICLFLWCGIFHPGESRHQAKIDARSGLSGKDAASQRLVALAVRWIFSYETAKAYINCWIIFMKWARDHMGLKRIMWTTAEHIEAYLDSLIEKRVSLSTFNKRVSALMKLQVALSEYALKNGILRTYDFADAAVNATNRAREKLEKKKQARGYLDPVALV